MSRPEQKYTRGDTVYRLCSQNDIQVFQYEVIGAIYNGDPTQWRYQIEGVSPEKIVGTIEKEVPECCLYASTDELIEAVDTKVKAL